MSYDDTEILDPEIEDEDQNNEQQKSEQNTQQQQQKNQEQQNTRLSKDDIQKLRKRFHADQEAAKKAEKGAVKQTKKQAAKQTGKQAGKQVAKQAAKQGAKAGGRVAVEAGIAAGGAAETAGASIAVAAAIEAAEQARQAAWAAVQSIKDWDLKKLKKYAEGKKKLIMAIVIICCFIVTIIIVIPLMIFQTLLLIFLGKDAHQKYKDSLTNNSTPFTITKKGPTEATLGQTLVYTITTSFTGTVEDITLTDTVPIGTDYVSSSPAGDYNTASRTITWSTKKSFPTTPNTGTFTLTLKATADNIYVVNKVDGNATPIASSSGNYLPPAAADSCGGKYATVVAKNKRLPLNFGDPVCNFTKEELFALLQKEDPANATFWFQKVIPCESGYNPNAYAGPEIGTPDPEGAWGLYQMGSSTPPGQPLSSPGKNGPNDRGDVNWEIQTINATTYGKKIGDLKRYWACAR
jgi:uncharacterized repeat protein (TIGR01451 family)